MGREPGKHRSKSRKVVLWGFVVSAVLAALGGTATFFGHAILGEFTDRSEAKVDAHRLAIDTDLPGPSCEYGGAFGYNPGDDLTRWGAGNDAVLNAVAATRRVYGFGLFRIHFTLPTTADKTAVDVRNIQVVARPLPKRPAWRLALEGCGGGQYHRTYMAGINAGNAHDYYLDAKGETVEESFEPFSVAAGETVYFDYVVTACDFATYAVFLKVEYAADTGGLTTQKVPLGEISNLGVPRDVMLAAGDFQEEGKSQAYTYSSKECQP
jgi:hypothetical protein